MDTSVANTYEDPRARAVRERYLDIYGGPEIPVPVEAVARDLLGLRIEQSDDLGDCSGVLYPAERRIVLNPGEAMYAGEPVRRHRFTIAHEVGHWVCHAHEGRAVTQPTYCRSRDLAHDVDRRLEREANVFAAELLMPEPAVRAAWAELREAELCATRFDVSTTAMAWRLYSFGLTQPPPAVDRSHWPR